MPQDSCGDSPHLCDFFCFVFFFVFLDLMSAAPGAQQLPSATLAHPVPQVAADARLPEVITHLLQSGLADPGVVYGRTATALELSLAVSSYEGARPVCPVTVAVLRCDVCSLV